MLKEKMKFKCFPTHQLDELTFGSVSTCSERLAAGLSLVSPRQTHSSRSKVQR